MTFIALLFADLRPGSSIVQRTFWRRKASNHVRLFSLSRGHRIDGPVSASNPVKANHATSEGGPAKRGRDVSPISEERELPVPKVPKTEPCSQGVNAGMMVRTVLVCWTKLIEPNRRSCGPCARRSRSSKRRTKRSNLGKRER